MLALVAMATSSSLFTVGPATAGSGDGTLTIEVSRVFTESGQHDPSMDIPQPDMDVRVSDVAGTAVTGVTDSAGLFVVTDASALQGGNYRVEVSIPSSMPHLQPAYAQLGGGYESFVSFVDVSGSTDVTVRTAVWNPSDYSQIDPPIAIPVQSTGAEARALIRLASESRGRGVATQTVQTQADVGTVYGTAYDPVGERLFSGAFAKRHTQYGSGGSGAIYVSSASAGSAASLFATVDNAGSTAHVGQSVYDLGFFDAPGKESLGDLELSEDGTELYVVNMASKELVTFDATGATAAAPLSTVAIPNPSCVGGEWRPMGLGVRDGMLYVGGVCDASISQQRADLRAVVYEYDGTSFDVVVSNPLDQVRGAVAEWVIDKSTHWNPWLSTFNTSNMDPTASGYARPMPELSDIAFGRDGSMVLGFRDRHGDQLGYNAWNPDNTGLIQAVSGGDTIMVCNTPGGYVWEGAAECPGNWATSYTGNQPSTSNEFFIGETVYLNIHREPTMGTVATLLRNNDVVTTAYDPMNIAYTSGVMYLSLTDGTGQYVQGSRGGNRGAEFMSAGPANNPWGKGNGLGDLSLLVEPAPIQIGNVVWFDADGDGIQGPAEPPLAGVTVNLIRNGVVIGTRVTDARGEYYFSTLDADLGGEFVALGGDYELEFVPPTTGTVTIPGVGVVDWSELSPTAQTAGSATSIDSNPDPTTGRAPYTAGRPGENDHTLDAGFVLPPPIPGYEHDKISDPVAGTTVVGGDTITYTVTGSNTGRTVLDPVAITDDLSAVLSGASVTGAPVATVYDSDDAVVAGAPVPAVSGTTLGWSGTLQPGERVELVYTVTLDADVAAGTIVENSMTSSATPPGVPPITPPGVVLEHPVPGYAHSKISDPVAGSTVRGGDAIGYTLSGVNTGATALDPVVITDDLSAVLSSAALTTAPVVTVYNADNSPVVGAPAASLSGDTLSWTGSLQIGQRVVITYEVTMDADVAAGTVVENRLSSSATPPGVPPITPPEVRVDHPVPGYAHAKTSDPVAGTAVVGGDAITYTVSGTNTGATALDPVIITDDLSAVLSGAAMSASPVATVYNLDDSVVPGSPAATVVGTTLSWSGTLGVGQRVELVYEVTINADVAAGTIVQNSMTSSATPPGVPPITPPRVVLEHPVPGYGHAKTSNPVSGSTVSGGDSITYTVTGRNTGATVLDPVAISDDLSGVLAQAAVTATPVYTVYNPDNSISGSGGATITGTTLSWTGPLQPGQRVEIVYTVVIDAGVTAGTIVQNSMTSSATPPGVPPITPPGVVVEHPVPGYTHAKTSDPVTGSTVVGGDTITYTVTGTNTGATVLNPVTITDDLIAVLNNAELSGAVTATIYNADDSVVAGSPAATVAGTSLSWTGALQPGQRVEIVYAVTLDADVAAGTVVRNSMTSSATPPGVPPITPPREVLEHPVPGYAHAKTSHPASGTAVSGGDTITYTLTGSNAGATVLTPVTITDDLSGVLAHATLPGPAAVVVYNSDNSLAASQSLPISGATLSWTGSLQPGQRVEIVYTAVIDADVEVGTVIENRMTSSATPPGSPPITPPEVVVGHPTPGLELLKTSTPGTDAAVVAGDTITYTVAARNTGSTTLDPVEVNDQLSGLLDHVTLAGTPTVTVYNSDNSIATTGVAVLTGHTLSWVGILHAGQRVEIVYAVTVGEAPLTAVTLVNTATAEGTPPNGPPLVPPPAVTEHPVAAYSLEKTGTTRSGSTVRGNDEIEYLITLANTGAALLDPVEIADDLSRVLDNSTMAVAAVASVGAVPTLAGTTLRWSGTLAVGETVLIRYTVRVDAAVADGTELMNVVTASVTPPGHPPIESPPTTTTHQVPPAPLPTTGFEGLAGMLALGLLLLGGGAALLVSRRSLRGSTAHARRAI